MYVVDFDIPSKNPSAHAMFYQDIHHLFMMYLGKDVKFSAESCYFTRDRKLAEKFLQIVKKFQGEGQIYKAVKTQERRARTKKGTRR